MKTVETLIKERNRIDSEIIAIENGIKDENTKLLIFEVLNLQAGVGAGFVESFEYDHYVPCRYYSRIAGVKNIRFGFDHKIVIKVKSPIGCCFPKRVSINGTLYGIEYIESKHFKEKVDY